MQTAASRVLRPNEYKILVEQSPILIWRSNTTAECDYFNERWLDFTGRTMEQECGNGWAEGVHREDFDRCLKIYLDAFGKREVFEMEYRLRRNDGEYRWIFDRGVPFHGDDGVFAGYIGSCIDITEQVLARETLLHAKEDEIKTLKGLLPICSNCHKIRDQNGQWHDLEAYIQEHTKASFTHGICGDCRKELYPEFTR
jgi:PAS domain S-box-containing protein